MKVGEREERSKMEKERGITPVNKNGDPSLACVQSWLEVLESSKGLVWEVDECAHDRSEEALSFSVVWEWVRKGNSSLPFPRLET